MPQYKLECSYIKKLNLDIESITYALNNCLKHKKLNCREEKKWGFSSKQCLFHHPNFAFSFTPYQQLSLFL
jgi:hypothetical protein